MAKPVFTAQTGISDFMPGNIALASLPPEGGATGGPAPKGQATAPKPKATASASTG
jgi:hypothetical protein